jgi:hypothetical protein
MQRRCLLAVGLVLVGSPLVAAARGGGGGHGDGHSSHYGGGSHYRGHSYSSGSRSHSKSTGKGYHKRTSGSGASGSVQRDGHGKIKRSAVAKAAFRRSHPCPSTGKTTGACPGYVVDHVKALKHGGSDSPDNMQWQTTAAAKAKDTWE